MGLRVSDTLQSILYCVYVSDSRFVLVTFGAALLVAIRSFDVGL